MGSLRRAPHIWVRPLNASVCQEGICTGSWDGRDDHPVRTPPTPPLVVVRAHWGAKSTATRISSIDTSLDGAAAVCSDSADCTANVVSPSQ